MKMFLQRIWKKSGGRRDSLVQVAAIVLEAVAEIAAVLVAETTTTTTGSAYLHFFIFQMNRINFEADSQFKINEFLH